MSNPTAEKGYEEQKAPLSAVMKVRNSVDSALLFNLFKTYGDDPSFALTAAKRIVDVWTAEDKTREVRGMGERYRRESIATEIATHRNAEVARVGWRWIERNMPDEWMERNTRLAGRCGSEESRKVASEVFGGYKEKVGAISKAIGEDEKTALDGLGWIEENMSDRWKSGDMQGVIARCKSEAAKKKATVMFAEAETREIERVESEGYLELVKTVLGPQSSFLLAEVYRCDEVINHEGRSPEALMEKADALVEVAKMLSLEGKLDITLQQLKKGLGEVGLKIGESGKIEKLKDMDVDMGVLEKLEEKDRTLNLVIEKARELYEEVIKMIKESGKVDKQKIELCESGIRGLDGFGKPKMEGV